MTTRANIAKTFGPTLQKIFEDFTENSKVPPLFYHYTKITTLEKILSSRKLRLSHVSKLDDKYEIRHAHKIAENSIKRYSKETKFKTLWNFILKSFQQINIFEYYILSFSDRNNNPNLWELYVRR